ncbi:RsmE family RNA methyltransferase [Limnovirga soli]|uniref:Ribosomal RNA small subunit methyltransferase E n=1 Tax=Limnovirga soli TaxID=2656915 RepID=A0A8J8JR38_9BACT|nr:RsmE family RNA methyltransferase [Limnovirga soli]NNV55442.1 RsmE family RNA methyltransferase [Limnovirga soli]
MALPIFYTNQPITAQQLVLSEETSRHCIQVLRMQVGEQLQLTNGTGSLLTTSIIQADKKHCTVHVETTELLPPPTKKVSIGISVLKNANRFEWFLEKATEIGVSEIIPLICQRTERQHFRYDRMNAILIAAMLQSQQTWLPILHEPQQVQHVIERSTATQKLIANCEEGEKQLIKQISLTNHIQMLIGPEGDFSPAEIKLAMQHNYQAVSLGSTRLRTETAGVVAATLLMNG